MLFNGNLVDELRVQLPAWNRGIRCAPAITSASSRTMASLVGRAPGISATCVGVWNSLVGCSPSLTVSFIAFSRRSRLKAIGTRIGPPGATFSADSGTSHLVRVEVRLRLKLWVLRSSPFWDILLEKLGNGLLCLEQSASEDTRNRLITLREEGCC